MAKILIICPKTKKPTDTGMEMDKQSFDSATLSNNSLNCPDCGETHVWDKVDAHLEENRPPV